MSMDLIETSNMTLGLTKSVEKLSPVCSSFQPNGPCLFGILELSTLDKGSQWVTEAALCASDEAQGSLYWKVFQGD